MKKLTAGKKMWCWRTREGMCWCEESRFVEDLSPSHQCQSPSKPVQNFTKSFKWLQTCPDPDLHENPRELWMPSLAAVPTRGFMLSETTTSMTFLLGDNHHFTSSYHRNQQKHPPSRYEVSLTKERNSGNSEYFRCANMIVIIMPSLFRYWFVKTLICECPVWNQTSPAFF